MPPISRTSTLEQFQKLENEHTTIGAQLHRLAELTGLECGRFLSTETALHHSRGNGRLVWALRWLLLKLHRAGPIGAETRRTTEAWTLLANILVSLQPFQIAHALSSHTILLSIRDALRENYGSDVQGLASSQHVVEQQGCSEKPVPSNPGSSAAVVASSARKRKRKDAIEPSIAPMKHRAVENSGVSTEHNDATQQRSGVRLFSAISACTSTLVTIAQNRNNTLDAYSLEYIRSRLVLEASDAASLMAEWLGAMTWSLTQSQSDGTTATEHGRNVIWHLSPVLHVWTLRSTSSENAEEISTTSFAASCLVPATLFLHQAKKIMNDRQSARGLVENLHDQTDRVEALIAKHIFIPAKMDYHRTPGRKVSTPSSSSTDSDLLRSLLRPLDTLRPSHLWPSHLRYAVTILYKIAIRCSPISGATRKPLDSAWLESVLIILTESLGFEINSASATGISGPNFDEFGKLLEITVRSRIALSERFAGHIASEISGLGTPHVRWSIVAQVLALDPKLFVPQKAKPSPLESDTASGLGSLLYSAITSDGWSAQICDPNHVELVGKDSRDNEGREKYRLIENKILRPLLKAYVAARSLREFLVEWHSQLLVALQQRLAEAEAGEKSVQTDTLYSIWEDSDLEAPLKQYVLNSFTPNQVSEVLALFAIDLDTEDIAQLNVTKTIRIAASASILSAIVDNLDDNIMERQVHDQVTQLLRLSAVHLEANFARKPMSSLVKAKLWRLFATCHRFISETSGVELIEQFQLTFQKVTAEAMLSLQSAHERSEAFSMDEHLASLACLGSVSEDLTHRSIDFQQFHLYDGLLEALPDAQHLSHRAATLYAAVLTRYPQLLVSSETGEQPNDQSKPSNAAASLVIKASIEKDTCASYWRSLCSQFTEYPYLAHNIYLEDIRNLQAEFRTLHGMDALWNVLDRGYLEMLGEQMPPKWRQTLLHTTITNLQEVQPGTTAASWCRRLSLALHLIDSCPLSEHLNVLPADLANVVETFDEALSSQSFNDAKASTSMISLLDAVVTSLFAHEVSRSKNLRKGRYQDFFKTMRDRFASTVGELSTFSKVPGCLVIVSITGTKAVCEKLSAVEDLAISDKVLSEYLTILVSTLHDLEITISDQEENSIVPHALLYATLNAISRYDMLQKLDYKHDIRVLVDKLCDKLKYLMLKGDFEDRRSYCTIRALAYNAQHNVGAEDFNVFEPARIIRALSDLSTSAAQNIVLDTFTRSFESLSDQSRTSMIDRLQPTSSDDQYTVEKLRILQKLAQFGASNMNTSLIPPDSISHTTLSLARQLSLSTTLTTLTTTASTISLLLRSHSNHHNQISIDTTLHAIVTTCSPCGPVLPPTTAPHIFGHLAHLLHVLLTHHRRALRGRFDLLIFALNAMLRVLFVPAPGTSNNPSATLSISGQHPPWAPRVPSAALSATHAGSYARLLTTLCDPTYAAARTAHGAHTRGRDSTAAHLSDVSKKARAYAAQYAPLVLLECCRCMLVGRLAEGAREGLLPGIWAIFEVCEREMLLAMSEGAGGAERSVLKSLREEWRRVGGGGGIKAKRGRM